MEYASLRGRGWFRNPRVRSEAAPAAIRGGRPSRPPPPPMPGSQWDKTGCSVIGVRRSGGRGCRSAAVSDAEVVLIGEYGFQPGLLASTEQCAYAPNCLRLMNTQTAIPIAPTATRIAPITTAPGPIIACRPSRPPDSVSVNRFRDGCPVRLMRNYAGF